MSNRTLSLFQLCDSNFPTGAFSHSYGLETYIQSDLVHSPETFSNWLKVYLEEQLVFSDGLAARLAYEALDAGDEERLWELDRLLTVQNLARETREGTHRIGVQMLKMAKKLYGAPILDVYHARIKDNQVFGHPALVFTMAGHYLEVDRDTTVLYYMYTSIVNLVQNAVRAIPLGQTAGQQIIYSLQEDLMAAVEKINQLGEDDFGIVSPGMELAQMQHERLNVRIFSS
ncbi:urease accessory protein UreF [Virgibacillus halophilus]|uniref:Urease accessory protein UreF n=2 Tax=Tigheibacillus halophilus TaxID=361280 RepID=A0ABU5C808_9BACI|nr:urease accessory protein UreF [Virgibacillus halophilus]